MYTNISPNRYKDEKWIHEFKEQQTSDAHMLRLNLTDKIDLQRSNNCMVFIKR